MEGFLFFYTLFVYRIILDKALLDQLQILLIIIMSADSKQGFPVQDFLSCIQSNRSTAHEFISQANSLNIEWIYEIIKNCHNIILESKQTPITKLSALEMVRDLLQTCQVPCINLIEIYILPIIYEISIQKPQQKGDKRGSTYFQQQARMHKIQNIEQTGIKFVRLCEEMLFAGALIKPKRSFQNKQLNNQASQFSDYFQKYKDYQIAGAPKSLTDIKYFSPQFLKNGRNLYMNNLSRFTQNSESYCEYFVTKIIQSLESANNPLFNVANASSSSTASELDMRKLLKTCDLYINSPLIQQLLVKLKLTDNFAIKKNCLSLLADFIKWGDAEAFLRISNDDALFNIGKRIIQVRGENGLSEGQNIYPQIKGQKQPKRKLYTQYLKSLQVIAKCGINSKLQIPQIEKIYQLYEFIKKDKKFEFPQNLMAKRIQSDFQENITYNKERNFIVLQRLMNQGYSEKMASKIRSTKRNNSSSLKQMNKDIEDCLEQLLKIPQNQSLLENRMNKLNKFKQNFDNQLDHLEEENTGMKEEELQQILDNGLELSKNIEKLEQFYQKYKNKQIGFEEFCRQHEILLRNYEQSSKDGSIIILNNHQSNQTNNKQSPEHFVDSYKPLQLPTFQRHPTFNGTAQTSFNGSNVVVINASSTAPNFEMKTTSILPNQPQFILTDYQLPSPQSSNIKKEKTSNQKAPSQIKANQEKQISKIRQNQSEKSKSQHSRISSGSTLRQRMEEHKKQKNKKQNNQIKSNYNENTQNGKIATYSEYNFPQTLPDNLTGRQFQTKPDPIVEYVQYVSPPSLRMPPQSHTIPLSSRDKNQVNEQKKTPYDMTNPQQLANTPMRVSVQSVQSQNNTNYFPFIGTIPQNKIQIYSSLSSDNDELYKELPLSNTAPLKKLARTNGYQSPKSQLPQYTITNFSNNLNKINGDIHSVENNQPNSQAQKNQLEVKQDPNKSKFNTGSNIKEQQWAIDNKSGSSQNENCYHSKSRKKLTVVSASRYSNKPSSKADANYNYEIPIVNEKSQFQQSKSKLSQYSPNAKALRLDEDDFIKEPDCIPLQNSYYGLEEIEKKVKNSARPQFRQCFQIDKEVIPISKSRVNNGLNNISQKASAVSQRVKIQQTAQVHQQYLIAKLRRQQAIQKEPETKQLQNQVLQLKTSNSKLRNQIKLRDELSEQASLLKSRMSSNFSQSSDKHISFSNNSKYSRSNSPSLKPTSSFNNSNIADSTMRQGIYIQNEKYERFVMNLTDEKVLKACLTNKSLIIKNQLCQIGCMLKKSQQNVRLTVYFTPFTQISNFSYSISKEPNLQIDSYCKPYAQIDANKQIKIQINAFLKNIPYTFPILNLSFGKGNEYKNVSFYLPLSINKFMDYTKIQKSEVDNELTSNMTGLLKTQQFKINPNVFRLKNLQEYFSNISNISTSPNSKVQKHAVRCSLKGYSFILLINIVGKQKMLLQGLTSNQQYYLMEYFMAVAQKIISIQK